MIETLQNFNFYLGRWQPSGQDERERGGEKWPSDQDDQRQVGGVSLGHTKEDIYVGKPIGGKPITRYQSTLAGGLHSLLFVHVTTDSGLDVSGHIDLAQRCPSKKMVPFIELLFYRCQEDPNFQKYIKGSKAMLPQVKNIT